MYANHRHSEESRKIGKLRFIGRVEGPTISWG